jgi:hypothetical protein
MRCAEVTSFVACGSLCGQAVCRVVSAWLHPVIRLGACMLPASGMLCAVYCACTVSMKYASTLFIKSVIKCQYQ